MKIALKLNLEPTIIMDIVVPDDKDEEEYIDEFLDSILAKEFRFNREWSFV